MRLCVRPISYFRSICVGRLVEEKRRTTEADALLYIPSSWTRLHSVWESGTAGREACVCTDVFLVSREIAECKAGRDVVRCGCCKDVTCQTLATPAHLCYLQDLHER